jgi:orotate phosphoribosyltransferase
MASLAKFKASDDDGGQSVVDIRFDKVCRQALLDIIIARSFRKGEFTLSSGKKSSLYFNMKPTMMCPKGATLTAKAFLQIMRMTESECVSGLEMGAVPAIGAMAAVSDLLGYPIKTTFVRKRKKEHGTQDLIEGLGPEECLKGQRVLVVDDVATSGLSILKAIEELRAAGGIVTDAAALVNRLEGGRELLSEHGVVLHSIFTADEFVD